MSGLVLSRIFIYPVKSLGGISLSSCFAGIRGLQHDRRYMLVDNEGIYMTQRNFPEMATFKLSCSGDGFLITRKGESLYIPAMPEFSGRKSVTVWDDRLDALLAPPHFGDWFTSQLEHPCHLVAMDDAANRPLNEKYRKNDETVSFADAFPYLLTGEASLNELNTRLDGPLPMNRFRPNLVFSGGLPFAEDSFRRFGIGEAVFRAVKPCARCVVITTDQETGVRGKEPLYTLSTYRKSENNVFFGQNLVCLREGRVTCGDTLLLSG